MAAQTTRTRRVVRELLALRPGVFRSISAGGRLYLLAGSDAESFGRDRAGLTALLQRLAGPPATDAELVAEHAVDLGAGAVHRLLERLRAGGWLAVTVAVDDRPAYTVVPDRRPPGLAPCALGAGDPAAFAAATGLDPLTEGSVGEFMLGSGPVREPPCDR